MELSTMSSNFVLSETRPYKDMETNTLIPDFYKNTYYPKEILVEVTEKSLARANRGMHRIHVGDKISLSIEVSDFCNDPDCKVGSFSANFFLRTPYGCEGKAYRDEKHLERSVRSMLIAYGFKFVEWKDSPRSFFLNQHHIKS